MITDKWLCVPQALLKVANAVYVPAICLSQCCVHCNMNYTGHKATLLPGVESTWEKTPMDCTKNRTKSHSLVYISVRI